MSLYPQVRDCVSKKVLPEEASARKLLDRGGEGLVSSQHQWQFNLLTHVESLQDEVTHRMDSIEKELDGRALSSALWPLACALLSLLPLKLLFALFLKIRSLYVAYADFKFVNSNDPLISAY